MAVGCTWSWGVSALGGAYLVPGGVPSPGGGVPVPGGRVPGLGGMYLVDRHTPVKNITLPQTSFVGGNYLNLLFDPRVFNRDYSGFKYFILHFSVLV